MQLFQKAHCNFLTDANRPPGAHHNISTDFHLPPVRIATTGVLPQNEQRPGDSIPGLVAI